MQSAIEEMMARIQKGTVHLRNVDMNERVSGSFPVLSSLVLRR